MRLSHVVPNFPLPTLCRVGHCSACFQRMDAEFTLIVGSDSKELHFFEKSKIYFFDDRSGGYSENCISKWWWKREPIGNGGCTSQKIIKTGKRNIQAHWKLGPQADPTMSLSVSFDSHKLDILINLFQGKSHRQAVGEISTKKIISIKTKIF